MSGQQRIQAIISFFIGVKAVRTFFWRGMQFYADVFLGGQLFMMVRTSFEKWRWKYPEEALDSKVSDLLSKKQTMRMWRAQMEEEMRKATSRKCCFGVDLIISTRMPDWKNG